jgi:hypothetical protein
MFLLDRELAPQGQEFCLSISQRIWNQTFILEDERLETVAEFSSPQEAV